MVKTRVAVKTQTNLHCLDLNPDLQGQALQYLVLLQLFCLGFTLGDMQVVMWVAYTSHVTSV